MTKELREKSAREIVSLISHKQASVREIVGSFLAQIEALNPSVNAVCTLNDAALADADAADRRLSAGGAPRPLEGVPFVVKDILPVKGMRTTYGSEIFRDHVADVDVISVERMRAAGGIVIGKSNTPEFAHDINTSNRIFGLTRNPLNLNVTAGGSSGGTGAAIAADMAPIGLGTDLGGSIRIPSSYGGISGIRPSPGRVPIYPADFGWDTLVEHVHGPMARTVADTGLVLSVLAGPDDRDPSSLPSQACDYAAAASTPLDLKGRRVAYTPDINGLMPVDAQVRELTRNAARGFEALGCSVEEACFDPADLREIIAGTRGFGMVARYADWLDVHADRMTSQLIGQVSDALKLDVRTITKAERLRTRYWQRLREFLERFDYLLTPTVGAPPFRLDQPLPTTVGGRPVTRYYDVFFGTYAFSVVGVPAMSVPCGYTSEGLPVGLQIIGRRLREDLVLGAAAAYAGACPQHFARRPPASEPIAPPSAELVTPGMRLG
ncbi:MAG: amidase [Hyphomicrobiaceae bacterium]